MNRSVPHRWWRARWVRVVAPVSFGLMALLAAPALIGTRWGAVRALVGQLSAGTVGGLAMIWLAVMLSYALVQTAALPGLTARQALTLNLSGSFVANVLPAGGAPSTVMNYAMARSWGLDPGAFASYLTVTNLVNLGSKLTLPGIGVAAALVAGEQITGLLGWTALLTTVLLIAVVLVGAALVRRESATVAARWLQATAQAVLVRFRSERVVTVESAVIGVAARVRATARTGWGRISTGLIVHVALQFLLFAVAVHAFGAPLGLLTVFGGFAVERVLTVAALTPGGTGVVEAVTTVVLVAGGGGQASSLAGVLLYRGFAFLLEIPVGALVTILWLSRRRALPPAPLPGAAEAH